MSFYQFSSYSISNNNGNIEKAQKFEYKDNKKHLKGELKQKNNGKNKYESMFKSINDFENEMNEKLWGVSKDESQWKMKKIKENNQMKVESQFNENYYKYSNFFDGFNKLEDNHFKSNFLEFNK